jgi:hypothetical protein
MVDYSAVLAVRLQYSTPQTGGSFEILRLTICSRNWSTFCVARAAEHIQVLRPARWLPIGGPTPPVLPPPPHLVAQTPRPGTPPPQPGMPSRPNTPSQRQGEEPIRRETFVFQSDGHYSTRRLGRRTWKKRRDTGRCPRSCLQLLYRVQDCGSWVLLNVPLL